MSANALEHVSHTYGRSPVCTWMCTVSALRWMKRLPQLANGHAYGRSCVCVRMCLWVSVTVAQGRPSAAHAPLQVGAPRKRFAALAVVATVGFHGIQVILVQDLWQ